MCSLIKVSLLPSSQMDKYYRKMSVSPIVHPTNP